MIRGQTSNPVFIKKNRRLNGLRSNILSNTHEEKSVVNIIGSLKKVWSDNGILKSISITFYQAIFYIEATRRMVVSK
jgi:hypothetical protein